MKKTVNKIRKTIKNTTPVDKISAHPLKWIEFKQYSSSIYIIKVYFKHSIKNKKTFKNITLPLIVDIAEKNNFYLLCEKTTDKFDNDLIIIYIKDKTKIETTPARTLYHISLPRNRKKILKEGLIPQPFEKSCMKNQLYYYYEPSLFLYSKKDYFYFLLKRNKYDIWKINTSRTKNKWFYDCNIGNDYCLMTQESIPIEALTLLKKQ